MAIGDGVLAMGDGLLDASLWDGVPPIGRPDGLLAIGDEVLAIGDGLLAMGDGILAIGDGLWDIGR